MNSLLNDEELKYRSILGTVKKEYEHRKERGSEGHPPMNAIARLCSNYIDNIRAYCMKEKVEHCRRLRGPNSADAVDRKKIDIPDAQGRLSRELMNYIELAIDGKMFDYRSNERLHKPNSILKRTPCPTWSVRWSTSTQAKIDIVKQRLVDQYEYDDQSAFDVLNFVASIFARGDAKDGEWSPPSRPPRGAPSRSAAPPEQAVDANAILNIENDLAGSRS